MKRENFNHALCAMLLQPCLLMHAQFLPQISQSSIWDRQHSIKHEAIIVCCAEALTQLAALSKRAASGPSAAAIAAAAKKVTPLSQVHPCTDISLTPGVFHVPVCLLD